MIGNKKKAGEVFEYQSITDFDDPKTTWHLKRSYLTRQEQLATEIRSIQANEDGLSDDKIGEERSRVFKEYVLEHIVKATDVLEAGDSLVMPDQKEEILKIMEDHFDTQDLDELANVVSYGPAKMANTFGQIAERLAKERTTKNASS